MTSNADASKSDLANIQSAIVELLRARMSELTVSQRIRIEQGSAEALAMAGRTKEAIAAYDDLARQRPNDGDVQEGYARLLLASKDQADWRPALDQWRRVAAKSKPRSTRWFRAKYSIALSQHKLGDNQRAAKLIRYLQATENLSQSGFAQEFEQLLERCQTGNQTTNGSP